ncbi:MAG: tetraacyldisaccharide 4'-kinase [Marinifilaceae bacterium]
MTKLFLVPFSLMYGFAVGVRNMLFNVHILSSKRFETPIITIGNLTVGGTGKTPHTEYIVEHLNKKYRVATLSRGYKRKSSGFVIAQEDMKAEHIGDEPLQIKRKFPNVTVACDADRVHGIEELRRLPENYPEVIVLDDAFQHRYVRADKTILLVDYTRPIYEDSLLPLGRLREPASARKRADYIVVTKCPKELSPIEQRIISKHLDIKAYQKLFFSYMSYGKPRSLNGETAIGILGNDPAVLCVTGIANPIPYHEYLKEHVSKLILMDYPDHHHFTARDIKKIESKFAAMEEENKIILTTEKDAMRLKDMNLPESIADRIYYIPIVPEFIESENNLIECLDDYIRRNKKQC